MSKTRPVLPIETGHYFRSIVIRMSYVVGDAMALARSRSAWRCYSLTMIPGANWIVPLRNWSADFWLGFTLVNQSCVKCNYVHITWGIIYGLPLYSAHSLVHDLVIRSYPSSSGRRRHVCVGLDTLNRSQRAASKHHQGRPQAHLCTRGGGGCANSVESHKDRPLACFKQARSRWRMCEQHRNVIKVVFWVIRACEGGGKCTNGIETSPNPPPPSPWVQERRRRCERHWSAIKTNFPSL